MIESSGILYRMHIGSGGQSYNYSVTKLRNQNRNFFLTQQYRLFSNYSASLQLVDNILILVIHEL